MVQRPRSWSRCRGRRPTKWPCASRSTFTVRPRIRLPSYFAATRSRTTEGWSPASRATSHRPAACDRAAFPSRPATVARHRRSEGAFARAGHAVRGSRRANTRHFALPATDPGGDQQNDELERSGGCHGRRTIAQLDRGETPGRKSRAIGFWDTTGTDPRPTDPCGLHHRRNAAVPERLRLCCRPQASHSLVHHAAQLLVLRPNRIHSDHVARATDGVVSLFPCWDR
jgi:hypothetical protein